MAVFLQIGLILLAISILVTIHELGHYWAARMFGIRVEVFSLFFGPRLFGFKRGDTDWRISLIPLGGYVKIAGMIDESMDKEQMASPPKPDEMRAKPKWQQLIVMLGGIIMNVLLGFVIFIGYKFMYGDSVIPNSSLKYGISVPEHTLAYEMGFRSGDKLLTYRGDSVRYFNKFMSPQWLIQTGKTFEVDRGGQKITIDLPSDLYATYANRDKQDYFFGVESPLVVMAIDSQIIEIVKGDTIRRATPGWEAGIRTGDSIVGLDSLPVRFQSEMRTYFYKKRGSPVQVAYFRDTLLDTTTVRLDSTGKMYAMFYDLPSMYDTVHYSFAQALAEGPKMGFQVVLDQIQSLRLLITGKLNPSKNLSGIVKISSVMKEGFLAGGWSYFWFLTGLLSMVLAIMNILPIPGLDGGHVVFLTIEMIIGRDIPTKVKEIAIYIGIFLVLGLILFTVGNDIWQMLK